MPIYEYCCRKCGAQFEELVFGANAVINCPQCGTDQTEKLMSSCRAKFGGGGSDDGPGQASLPSSGGGCAGCSGGSCSTCG
ncbi:FmdB family zinc ribbon protein [Desulfohalobium retbaense]|uniref:Regulatory protein, FmdB family n=1 Tax=Desulfohalobium retbaense (strain ATCC 49708 / DSM 5692 / JCM 16813 / HR100) TaxID=485915 RepID=C8X0N2_DESRD|nr:zinc ribbon domain-containing protein [Desulfohalobium retbaense]ACV67979.1 regulatory protein, FmdB family [Desulfohalobium retbaense DSM 5692]